VQEQVVVGAVVAAVVQVWVEQVVVAAAVAPVFRKASVSEPLKISP
jgi:hypothetical protein